MTKLYFSATEIAQRLSESLERIQYVIRRNNIQPTCVCGGRNGYDQEQLKVIKINLNKIRQYSKCN